MTQSIARYLFDGWASIVFVSRRHCSSVMTLILVTWESSPAKCWTCKCVMWHVSVMTTTVRCELWVCQTVSAQCSLSIIRRVYVIANLTRRRRPSAAGPACRHVARPLTHIPSLVSGLIDGVDIAAAAAAGNRTKRHGRRLDSTRVMPISWKDVAHVEIGPSVRPYVSIVCPSAWCYWCCGRAACTLLRYMINGATL